MMNIKTNRSIGVDDLKEELYKLIEEIGVHECAQKIFMNMLRDGRRQYALLQGKQPERLQRISFTVDGAPVPKGRPRTTMVRGKPTTYTPKRTREYEKLVKTVAREAMRRKATNPFKGPVKLTLIIRRKVARGDLSNFVKAVEDAMNGVCYDDDRQIVKLEAWFDDSKTEDPGVDILVAPL